MRTIRHKAWLNGLIFPIVILLTTGCARKESAAPDLTHLIDSIGIDWVPDLREGIFDVQLTSSESGFVLRGETTVPESKDAITGILEKKGVTFQDSLIVLPEAGLAASPWGLVTVSVCNIRFTSSYDAEMVSQAVMGTPMKIFKQNGGWLLVQTPDMYLGWVDSDAIAVKSVEEHRLWRSSERLLYTDKTGDVFADRSMKKPISDIVAGCIVEIAGTGSEGFDVKLPDGRRGFIPAGRAVSLEKLSAGELLTPENLVSSAESFMGIPYLWGGTSLKGFDCSGFVKTVYYLNGIILDRDASQQFQNGIRIRARRESFPDSLQTGDLMFFGSSRRGRPRATHVGMYIGNGEFIHCSGMVKINSLDSTRTNFSESRRDSYLGARRMIGTPSGKGAMPLLEHHWYF
ncbi:MAG: C40 family peptidase [Bacteroidales bacterium]|nr:C40 family peptidase [Bacteroidales bacterium]